MTVGRLRGPEPQRRIATDAFKRIDFTGASVTLIARGATLIISVSLNASRGVTRFPGPRTITTIRTTNRSFALARELSGYRGQGTEGVREETTVENELFILPTAVVLPRRANSMVN